MTNAEKYKDAIMAQMCKTGDWAVDRTGKIMSCALNNCAVCTFSGKKNPCFNEKKKWLNTEADEKKAFSEKDKEVIRALDEVQWVARDKNGRIYGYHNKPLKVRGTWLYCFDFPTDLVHLSTAEFSSVKYEDDKPTSREEILGEDEK